MTLKEKFKQWLDTDPRLQIREVQLEVIAEDFAIEFLDFVKNETDYDAWNSKFDYKGTLYNSKELLEIYKKENGL